MKKPYVVKLVRRFDQTPERIFDLWLDPARVAQWFAPGLGTMTTVEIDARVGGRFNFTQDREGHAAVHVGEYKEIEPPKRLVFTWATPEKATDTPDDVSTVTIEVERDGKGSKLTLTHEMDAKWAEWGEKVLGGWAKMLDLMAQVA